MKMIIMKTMIVVPTMISMMKTPMSMGIMLMIQTFLSTIIIAKSMSSSWMPMIMFLMLIGGLLILFMYMSSIASNEKFKISMKMFLPSILIVMLSEDMLLEKINQNSNMNMYNMEMLSLNMIFMKKYLIITLLIFLMLLLTMVSVIYIMKIHKGPLRSKTYE
uniref:NADH dehydrogenase subunit 6 n=1 Tax=Chanohirata hamata TaxID=3032134 RepID=A0A7G8JRY6_9HEMI|nr:NADH dehydrogenase subunit 6 [Chanohirata hamata]QNJ33334.1 NADH dehydrogenase subunit 6 [Chanohirata hamata]